MSKSAPVKPPSKRASITGITGQDGFYFAEFLLEKGCDVHGIKAQRPLMVKGERS